MNKLISLVLAVAYGKPSGSYNYPAPTPSAAPAYLSNVVTPSPSVTPSVINLPAPTASIAPQFINLPSPTASVAPSLFNLPQPVSSIAPFLQENVVGAAQYASPVVNIGGQSLGYQSLGGQSLGYQSFGAQPLGLQSLGLQPFNYGLSQSQFNLPLQNQGLNFIQQGSNFGGLLPIGSPQLSVDSSHFSLSGSGLSATAAPILTQTSGHLNFEPIGPTVSAAGINFQEVNPGRVVVQKHIYVHVPPEEPEERTPPRPIVLPPPKKHYKLIFIKAPTPPTPTAPVIPAQPQDEERTIIYVLVKRPEEQPEIKIQTPPPTVPAKPEIYFIRYATRKEGVATGTIPSGPVPIDGGLPIVEDKGSDNVVRIGDSGIHSNVALNLNTASLSGGSALSLAVTGSPLDNTLQVSSTPVPRYGPPEHK